MKKLLRLTIFIGLVTVSFGLNAQNMSDMRINEFLVTNTDDFEDDFGHKNGWIELFNKSYGTVDIGGCFLTNDPSNLTKYMVPKGDVLTKIKPRQHILFWADNQPFRGTFHINFKLEDSDEIILVSSDGRTIIDRVRINHKELAPNVSYGRTEDGIGSNDGTEGWQILEKTSPSTNNFTLDGESKSMKLQKHDPYGIVMSITSMSVVFLALILLYIVFKHIGKASIRSSQKKSDIVTGNDSKVPDNDVSETSGEVIAAISLALQLFKEENEAHDYENTILTIDKVKRSYSPWSSKIYTLRETPQLRKR